MSETPDDETLHPGAPSAEEAAAREARRARFKERQTPVLERLIARREADGERREAGAYRWALREMTEADNIAPAVALASLNEFPVAIDEFVESNDFMGYMTEFRVWPTWRPELKRMNPDVVCGEPPVTRVVLGGATSTGKSEVAMRSLLHRALARLLAEMGESEGG